MLLWANNVSELDFEKLMQVYREGNQENALEFYPDLEPERGQVRAEQDFLDYLTTDFFNRKGARYGIWEEAGNYITALRLEPWEDGLLLQALETHPDHRRCGFAKLLIREVQKCLPGITIYSHVSKRNKASLATHQSCGFCIHKDSVRLLDGTVSANGYTLCWPRK